MGVKVEGVILDREATVAGDLVLPALDFGVVEFFDLAAIDTDQMIVMVAAIDLENRLAGLEEMAFKQAGLLELGQYPINRRQANVHVFADEHPVDIFRRHVPHAAFFEQLKDLEAGKGGLESHVLETLRVAHCFVSIGCRGEEQLGISGMIYRFKDV